MNHDELTKKCSIVEICENFKCEENCPSFIYCHQKINIRQYKILIRAYDFALDYYKNLKQ